MTLQDTATLYDFVPMPERKPLKWPNGKRRSTSNTGS
jgi:hypothetical protein